MTRKLGRPLMGTERRQIAQFTLDRSTRRAVMLAAKREGVSASLLCERALIREIARLERKRKRQAGYTIPDLVLFVSVVVFGFAAGWIFRSLLDWNQFQNMFGPTL